MQSFWDYTYREYYDVFKIILVFFILFGTFVLKIVKSQQNKFLRNDKVLLIIFVVIIILFVGLRAYNIGTDTPNYLNFFFYKILSRANNYLEIFTILKSDFLFEVLVSFSYWHQNFTLFLLTVSIIMNLALYHFVRKFTNYGMRGSSLILFLTLACSFSFMSIEVNILRNGLSICFILLGLNAILENQIKPFIIYIIIGYLFHRTAVIPIALILAVFWFNKVKIKYFIAFYILTVLASLVGFGFHAIPFLSQLGGEDFSKLSHVGDTTYRIGFRFDFVLYNTFFLGLFLKFTNWNAKDTFLIKYFILSSAVFFLNFYIPFSDRFGVYSWITIPLLLFNTINETFPKKKLSIATFVLIGFFTLNYIILFP